MGSRVAKDEITEIAIVDLTRLALMIRFFSIIAARQLCLYARRGSENSHLLISPPDQRYLQTQDQEAQHD